MTGIFVKTDSSDQGGAAPRQLPAAARLSLGAGVAAGFVVLVVLMSALIWLALARVAELNRNVTELVEVNNLKVALATRMKNALRERAIIMHTMSVMMDPFGQDAEFLRFQDIGAEFTSARTQLEFIASGEEETAILARMRELTFSTQPVVVEAINLALKQRRPEARALIEREIIPRQKKLAAEIDALLEIQQQAARAAAQSARALASDTRALLLILGAIALGVGAAVATMAWRHARRQQQLLERQALYDNLTELPNRRLFTDRLEQAVLAAEREHRAFGLMLLDLNRFKYVNDTLGHHAGDLVLRETAERVRSCLRAADTVARLGGDEMAVVMPNTATPEAVQAMANRLQERLFQPYRIEGRDIELGASIGIAMYPPSTAPTPKPCSVTPMPPCITPSARALVARPIDPSLRRRWSRGARATKAWPRPAEASRLPESGPDSFSRAASKNPGST